jgi:dynein heavy chain-like protein
MSRLLSPHLFRANLLHQLLPRCVPSDPSSNLVSTDMLSPRHTTKINLAVFLLLSSLPVSCVYFDVFQVLDEINPGVPCAAPRDGVYMKGLFIEGARWDYENHCLTDQRPKVWVWA